MANPTPFQGAKAVGLGLVERARAFIIACAMGPAEERAKGRLFAERLEKLLKEFDA